MITCYKCETCATGLESFPPYHDSASECKDLTKITNYPYCCYTHIKVEKESVSTESNYCLSFTQDQYKRMEDVVEERKRQYENNGYKVKKYSIDCNANYLGKALFALILILF